jgi:hypothetical protein
MHTSIAVDAGTTCWTIAAKPMVYGSSADVSWCMVAHGFLDFYRKPSIALGLLLVEDKIDFVIVTTC